VAATAATGVTQGRQHAGAADTLTPSEDNEVVK
jgi:hypothetical protein